MPANNALEWFAGGNVPRKKRPHKAEVVHLVAPQEPKLATESVPATASEPTKEPVSTTEPKVTSETEMPKLSCSNGSPESFKGKKVQFKDQVLKSAMKKGTEKANSFDEKTKQEEGACTCNCKACNLRNAKVDSSNNNMENKKTEKKSESDSAAKKGGKQNKQKGQQQNKQQKQQNNNSESSDFRSFEDAANSNNAKPLKEHQNNSNTQPKESQGDFQGKIYSKFVRRNMSRLIQPSRSEVIIREDVIECPSDPQPNAFFDARVGILRVYHGPHYGNAFGSLMPLANQGIAIGSTMGSGMPMSMGGNFMGGSALGMNQAAPMMSGAFGGWPGLARMDDPANNPHWTAVSGPGVQWSGIHKGSGQLGRSGGYSSVDMRGDYGRGDGGQQRGENTAGNSKNWSNHQQGNSRKERNYQNQNSPSGNNDPNHSAGENWGGNNNSGDCKDNRNNSEASNTWNNDSNNNTGNDRNGDNNPWNNNSNDNANDNSNSNQDNVDAFANLPGSWNDDDGNNDNDNDNNGDDNHHGWHRPATPPGWTANNGDASAEQNWGGDNSNDNNANTGNWNQPNGYTQNSCSNNNQSRSNQHQANSNNRNNHSSYNSRNPSNNHHNNNKKNQSRLSSHSGNNAAWNPATQTALSGGSWDNSGTGPTGGSNYNSHNTNNDNNTWGPPAVQASWADPSMAATVDDWHAGGGGGGGGDDVWR